MSNEEILKIALAQSAIDSGCLPEDFTAPEGKVVPSGKNPGARRYLELPFLCDFVSYGNNVVASVSPEYTEIAGWYIQSFLPEHCFETPAMELLAERLRPLGAGVCFMAEYWLPDISRLSPLPCPLETRILTDFSGLYLPQWGNALCESRKELDVLGVGAYHKGELVGLAGCSADCGDMWQIGVDVLPAYRKRGIASALTSALALEILSRGKVPFYCCAWSNVKSARNAVRSGFSPAWAQMTVKPLSFIRALAGEKR